MKIINILFIYFLIQIKYVSINCDIYIYNNFKSLKIYIRSYFYIIKD